MDALTSRIAPSHSSVADKLQLASGIVLVVCVLFVLVLHFSMAMTRTVNWDEFHFLSRVHDFARGELSLPLQTLHVRFFGWLTELDLPGVDQIIRARAAMFAALIGTSVSIFLVARRFVGCEGAAICALAYLASGYVIQHGTSFRFDPIIALTCMSALAILARSSLRWPWLLAFGIIMGVGFMVSMKIVLYLPAFAGIAWLRWSEGDFSIRRAMEISAAPVLAVVAAGLIFLSHSANMPPSGAAETMVGRAGTAMFGISPFIGFSVKAVLFAMPTFALLVFISRAFRQGSPFSKPEQAALIGLVAPILCLFFYTNTFPYFFAFILPPVCAGLAGTMRFVVPRYGVTAIAGIFALWAALVWSSDGPSQLEKQRSIQVAASELFPEPVKYFDFPGFLPQHSKANFFMSIWGFRDYRAGVFPSFREIMETETVPLVATVDAAHKPRMRGAMEGTAMTEFFVPGDVEALRSTYRPVWGPLWVAGTELEPLEVRNWTVRVPGQYTVEGTLTIEGRTYGTGDVITIDRGEVRMQAGEESSGLLYGDNISIPQTPAPERPYWTMF